MAVDAIEWQSNVTENIETQKVNVGLIGKGYWGEKIFDELKVHNQIDEIVCVTRSSLSNLNDILLDKDITHVFIATPVETHYELCKKNLRAKKHIMCEKNFTETYAQALELNYLKKIHKRNILVDYIYTFNPMLNNIIFDSNVEISLLQWGHFRNEHIISMLGSHALSILNSRRDLQGFKVVYKKLDKDESEIYLNNEDINVKILVSRIRDKKERILKVGNIEYNLMYDNGIKHMIDLFLNNYSNMSTALNVSSFLDKIGYTKL